MESFNKLTPAEDERLAILLEELGESIQCIGKIQRHSYEGFHPEFPEQGSNRDRLMEELGHVQAAIQLMCHAHDLEDFKIGIHKHNKLINVRKYLHHQ